MIAVIVDTDVVSFLFKGSPLSARYQRHISGKICAVSFMTLAELNQCSLEHRWGSRQCASLNTYLKRFIILWSEPGLCGLWAEIRAQARQKGIAIGSSDAWIAATALLYNCPLVTHNRKDFISVNGLTVISEP